MFVTTHSPIFVDRIDFDNSSIWFVTKEKKITKVERVNVDDGQNLKEILVELGIRMSDVFFAERLLFVEGATEREIIPLIAEKLKVDLNRKGVEIIAMRGKDTGKYHIKMWSHIAKNTQLPVFYLFDGDATQEIEESRKEGFLTEDNHYLLSVYDIEDLYPEDIIQKVINSMIPSIEIEKENLSPPRKEKLRKIFEKNNINEWKISFGKKVVSEMTEKQTKEIMGEIREVFNKFL
jgi:predicted ATP-dependent endonuclease of OLD family